MNTTQYIVVSEYVRNDSEINCVSMRSYFFLLRGEKRR